ncbi:orotidine-5'-phosphate decarboxylase [Thiorhodospira sibirica]|uniref:orotidine-5'-phosphate decarboxylase n=1 Tax=Thiorhodospira sibirica TaxID=154347 RepID=UPI00022C5E59|nr:orotidine-5'-phosphate decarboxylase [Thiorhodospira sibirica]
MNVSASPRVILALDFSDIAQLNALVERLDPTACRLKVGFELFVTGGPALVEQLIAKGFEVFLDLKFHDIPNTVTAACKAACQLGVWMLNVHASGGQRMLLAAREAVDSQSHRPQLIAVTVLTSMDQTDLQDTGVQRPLAEQVMALAHAAQVCGLDGIVCSAQEAPAMRTRFGPAFLLVTPGIRLPGDQHGDQRRIVTPAQAIFDGASYLVMGRSITQAKDPMQVLSAVNQSLVLS